MICWLFERTDRKMICKSEKEKGLCEKTVATRIFKKRIIEKKMKIIK